MKLYHGSAYKTELLMPGIKHTGIKVYWDETESNEYLYFTTSKHTAISLGFASAFEKKYGCEHYSDKDDGIINIVIDSNKIPTEEELQKLEVYIYTITVEPKYNILKNNNQYNDLKTEYKTKNNVAPDSMYLLDIKKWLMTHIVKITSPHDLLLNHVKW